MPTPTFHDVLKQGIISSENAAELILSQERLGEHSQLA
jgi:hypothetical protein